MNDTEPYLFDTEDLIPKELRIFAKDLFVDKVALITGGGTGLGRQTAIGFAAHGANLVLAGRRVDNLGETAQQITAFGSKVLCVPTDIRDVAQVNALYDQVYDEFGKVDFLINNAGGQYPSLPSEISDNGWRAVIDLNLNGTWNMTRTFMSAMAKSRFGSIINVVHIFSFDRGAPLFAHSGAARAGVVNLTKTLAPYLGRHGVTINAFAPGVFATEGLVEAELESLGRDEETFEKELISEGTTTRLGTVGEMAAVILFLCSPAARYINGSTIIADGAASQSNWVDMFEAGMF